MLTRCGRLWRDKVSGLLKDLAGSDCEFGFCAPNFTYHQLESSGAQEGGDKVTMLTLSNHFLRVAFLKHGHSPKKFKGFDLRLVNQQAKIGRDHNLA